jgi:serine/threonine-protein kinase
LIDMLRQATLGEYDILAELGRGGMATVYLAHDIALARKVAIKVMSPALFADAGFAERFKREARTAASLSHPNIIPIYAVKEDERLLYFVMKFIEGRPLDSIIKELGALPIPMVQAIVNQVGSALGYAHKRHVVHRDVKPANIMVDSDGWAVVTDFGIAKVSEVHGLTMTGATVGTPSYMSPEQCAAKELTGASDQYSLGVVAYEMLTGRLPFRADSVMAIMYAHFNEPPAPIRDGRPDAPPELAAAVMRMLEKDPAQRWPNLEAAVGAVGGAPLAHDDPIRTQLVTLAAAGAASQLAKRISTPVSPQPLGRTGKTTATIAGLRIAPARVQVAVGDAVQLSATARRTSGSTQAGRGVTWASTNTDVVTVSAAGLATGVTPGSATVTATQENTSATATIVVTPAGAPRRRKWPAVAALLVAGAAAGVWWLKPWQVTIRETSGPAARAESTVAPRVTVQPLGPPPAAPVPRAAADSLPPPSRPNARPTRPRPAPERARPSAPVAAAREPRKDSAPGPVPAVLPQGAAATPPVTSPAPAPSAAAPTPTPAPPPAVTPAPVDPRPQIERAIATYAEAVQARDLAAVRRIAPGLSPERLQGLRDFFQVVRDLRVSFRVGHVDLRGESAQADVTFNYDYVHDGKNVNQAAAFRATLERGTDGWRITALQ